MDSSDTRVDKQNRRNRDRSDTRAYKQNRRNRDSSDTRVYKQNRRNRDRSDTEPVSFTERSCRLENVPMGGTEAGRRPDKVDRVDGMGRFISFVTGGTEVGGRPDRVDGWMEWAGLFLSLRVAIRG